MPEQRRVFLCTQRFYTASLDKRPKRSDSTQPQLLGRCLCTNELARLSRTAQLSHAKCKSHVERQPEDQHQQLQNTKDLCAVTSQQQRCDNCSEPEASGRACEGSETSSRSKIA